MSPSGVALATLLHVAVAAALFWVSPLRNIDQTPDPIEITMEQEVPPPPPAPQTPPPAPTPAPDATPGPGGPPPPAAATACAASSAFSDGLERTDRHDEGSARCAQSARRQCGQAGSNGGGDDRTGAEARAAKGSLHVPAKGDRKARTDTGGREGPAGEGGGESRTGSQARTSKGAAEGRTA